MTSTTSVYTARPYSAEIWDSEIDLSRTREVANAWFSDSRQALRRSNWTNWFYLWGLYFILTAWISVTAQTCIFRIQSLLSYDNMCCSRWLPSFRKNLLSQPLQTAPSSEAARPVSKYSPWWNPLYTLWYTILTSVILWWISEFWNRFKKKVMCFDLNVR